MTVLRVNHNIEVAHRLTSLPGKCQQIHGHSMIIHLEVEGEVDNSGLFEGLDFGRIKKLFRSHLDSQFDHHLLLNCSDPLLDRLGLNEASSHVETWRYLPGAMLMPGDPTVENIAKWICEWAYFNIGHLSLELHELTIVPGSLYRYTVTVEETKTNSITHSIRGNAGEPMNVRPRGF